MMDNNTGRFTFRAMSENSMGEGIGDGQRDERETQDGACQGARVRLSFLHPSSDLFLYVCSRLMREEALEHTRMHT